ncbi:MAG: T9SS type A sorting domain-containing protein [candidate division Zixibacteria bacterium]|jgi:hypothetical protein|nr:T9SS type A sorting domain-containing protein [candidate division Zixibacteria bacterium]
MTKIARLLLGLAPLLFIGSAGAVDILHQDVIGDLATYHRLSPIASAEGGYRGFVASDLLQDRIDIYDIAGVITDSLLIPIDLSDAIARLSEGDDMLLVYVLTDTSGSVHGTQFHVPRVTLYTLPGPQPSAVTDDPELISLYNPAMGTYIVEVSGRLAFEQDTAGYPSAVILRANISTSLSEGTMGTRSDGGQSFVRYGLDLAARQVWGSAGDYVTGDFCGAASAGYARFVNWMHSVADDPWNSGYWWGTYLRVGLHDSVAVGCSTDEGASYRLFAGNFDPASATDELIHHGRAIDMLGLDSTASRHLACYSFADSSVSIVWRISEPTGFVAHHYLPERNVIVGLQSNGVVLTIDCATGAIVDSIPLGRAIVHPAFLFGQDRTLPDLFGRVGDTVFVFAPGTPTDVEEASPGLLPNSFVLRQNYPNPFNPTTTISFDLPVAGEYRLTVYNTLGQEVDRIDGMSSAGSVSIEWNGSGLASGVYLYKVTVADFEASRKMLLLK